MLSANRLEAEARSASWDLRGMLAARPVSWRRHDEVSQQASVGSRTTTRDSTVCGTAYYIEKLSWVTKRLGWARQCGYSLHSACEEARSSHRNDAESDAEDTAAADHRGRVEYFGRPRVQVN